MVENEYKFLVDKDNFYEMIDKIKTRYPFAGINEKIQINYYYDTDKLDLHKQNITLRARQSENSLKLEVKRHISKENDYHISLENSFDLPKIPNYLSLPSHKISGLDPMSVYKLQGNLITYRTSISISDRINIEFDKNFYLGICDYEVEIEFTKENMCLAKNLTSYLSLSNINVFDKSARFFITKGELVHDITI